MVVTDEKECARLLQQTVCLTGKTKRIVDMFDCLKTGDQAKRAALEIRPAERRLTDKAPDARVSERNRSG